MARLDNPATGLDIVANGWGVEDHRAKIDFIEVAVIHPAEQV